MPQIDSQSPADLEDRCAFIHIVETGRGRFRLNVDRPLSLVEHAEKMPHAWVTVAT